MRLAYEVHDKTGEIHAAFKDRDAAHDWARKKMAGEQDSSGDGEKPNGWDVQVAGRCS